MKVVALDAKTFQQSRQAKSNRTTQLLPGNATHYLDGWLIPFSWVLTEKYPHIRSDFQLQGRLKGLNISIGIKCFLFPVSQAANAKFPQTSF